MKLNKEFAKQLGQLAFWGAFIATAILLISECAFGKEVEVRITGQAVKVNCLNNPDVRGCVKIQTQLDLMKEYGEEGDEFCPDRNIHYCYIIRDGVLQADDWF